MSPAGRDSESGSFPASPGKIIFIRLSEALRDRIQSQVHHHHHHEEGDDEDISADDLPQGEEPEDSPFFAFDPAIPIPVELPAGETGLDNLSREMILSGMLRVLSGEETLPALSSAEEELRRRAYYRGLTLALRPGIQNELTEAAILKARNGDYALALEILGILKGLCPGAPSVLLNQAMVFEERAAALERAGQETAAEGEFLAAEAVYSEALAMENPLPDILFNAGHFFLGRRDYSRALICFRAYGSLEDEGDGGPGIDPEKRENALALAREIEEHGLEDEDFREAW